MISLIVITILVGVVIYVVILSLKSRLTNALPRADMRTSREKTNRSAESTKIPKNPKKRKVLPTSHPTATAVDASVFCPNQIVRGAKFITHVWLHLPDFADVVSEKVMSIDKNASKGGTYSLPIDVPIGTRIDIFLDFPDFHVENPSALIIWRGNSSPVQFECAVPINAPIKNYIGRVKFAIAGIPIGVMLFQVEVINENLQSYPNNSLNPIEIIQGVRYRRAFASYSSEDRAEVLRRIQGCQVAGLSIFQDILDLGPGERWNKRLYLEIDNCDLFLLFWSKSAASSEWVAKEIEYAIQRKSGNENHPPIIQPVPIDGPPPTSPPESLKHLHFNDAILAHIALEPLKRRAE